MTTHLPSLQGIRFENCICCYPDESTPIFLATQRKVDWYLNKGLATLISENPTKILLKFKPKGNGHKGRTFFMTPQIDRCVVCGKTEDLTRHHIVPYCYSKHFPTGREFATHDIVLLCEEHHVKAEEYIQPLRAEIIEKYNVPPDKQCPIVKALWHGFNLVRALIEHSDEIPEPRQQEIKWRIYECTGITKFDIESLLQTAEILHKDLTEARLKQKKIGTQSKKIVAKVEDLNEFAIYWRKHFIEVMNPQFMPEFWNVNARFYE